MSTSLVSPSELESILDSHLSRSHKYRNHEKRWDCPSCGGGNVTLREKDGAVQCWECGAKLKDILQATDGGWKEWLDLAYPDQGKDDKIFSPSRSVSNPTERNSSLQAIASNSSSKSAIVPPSAAKRKTSKKKVRPLPSMEVPKNLRTLKLTNPSFCPVQDEYHSRSGCLVSTYTFAYSSTQQVRRYNLPGGKKDFKFLNLVDGRWVNRKGVKEFPPYRMDEVFSVLKTGNSDNKPNSIFMAEGETCADYVRACLKRACISVDGSAWNEKALTRLAVQLKQMNLCLVYLADNDGPGVKKAELVQQVCRQVGVYCLPIHLPRTRWIGEVGAGQDIADLLKAIGGSMSPEESYEEFLARTEAEYEALCEDLEDEVDEQHKKELEEVVRMDAIALPGQEHPEVKPNPVLFAEKIGREFFGYLRWVDKVDGRSGSWWRYSKAEGIWSQISQDRVKKIVLDSWKEVAQFAPPSLHNMVSVIEFLKVELMGEQIVQSRDYIPFKNGVLHKKTRLFTKHHPRHNLLWTLPFDYQEPNGKGRLELMQACGPIVPWLYEATGSKNGNLELANLLLAYLAATLWGMTHLQKYLECIGPPGSGKGTFLRLAQAVIGGRNTTSTSLSKLETSRFESAKVAKAPLVLITDAERFAGSCLTLQSLTGQDVMSGERKGEQEEVGDGQPAVGMVILAGESIPKTSGSTGVNRRRITVPFTRQVKEYERKDLLTIETVNRVDRLSGEFAPYIPALINLLLSYSEEEIKDYVLHTSTTVKALTESKADNILATNPLAAWADEHLIWDDEIDPNKGFPRISSRVGRVAKEGDGWRDQAWTQLYPSYVNWCQFNNCKPVSGNSFSSALIELFNHQLGLPIFKRLERDGARMYGLAVRPDGNLPTDDDEKDGLSYERPITTIYVKKEMGRRKVKSCGSVSSSAESGCGVPPQNVMSCGGSVVSETPDFWDMLGTLDTFGSLKQKEDISNCHIGGTQVEEKTKEESDNPQSASQSSNDGLSDTTPAPQRHNITSQDTTEEEIKPANLDSDPTEQIDPDLGTTQVGDLLKQIPAAQFLSSISSGEVIQFDSSSDTSKTESLGMGIPLTDTEYSSKGINNPEVWDNSEELNE